MLRVLPSEFVATFMTRKEICGKKKILIAAA
jgi:hypothetical protein